MNLPTKAQAKLIKANGLFPFAYAVLHDSDKGLIVVNCFCGDVKHIKKEGTKDE